jgi:hypothetical protein
MSLLVAQGLMKPSLVPTYKAAQARIEAKFIIFYKKLVAYIGGSTDDCPKLEMAQTNIASRFVYVWNVLNHEFPKNISTVGDKLVQHFFICKCPIFVITCHNKEMFIYCKNCAQIMVYI